MFPIIYMLLGTAVATVACSAQTTAANVMQKLAQMCGNPVSTNAGRVLRPKVSFAQTVSPPQPHLWWTYCRE